MELSRTRSLSLRDAEVLALTASIEPGLRLTRPQGSQ
jgi:hypothetical protein